MGFNGVSLKLLEKWKHLQVLESELLSEDTALENNIEKMLLCMAKGNVRDHFTSGWNLLWQLLQNQMLEHTVFVWI